jgi:DNA gyrase subunit A
VRGIRLDEGQRVLSLIVPEPEGRVLTISENGYGKRTSVDDFPTKGRGTMGVLAMQISDRNGGLAGAVQVFSGDELMLITDQGTAVRTRTDEVSELGRITQGVRVIRLKEGEHLVGAQRVAESVVADLALAEAAALAEQESLAAAQQVAPAADADAAVDDSEEGAE